METTQFKLPDTLMDTILTSNPPRTHMVSLYTKLLTNGGKNCVSVFETSEEIATLMARGAFQADQEGRASRNIKRQHSHFIVGKPNGSVVDECSCGSGTFPCQVLNESIRLTNLKVEQTQGSPSGCHQNSARLWSEGKGKTITGYALSDDGLWRQHSWINAGDHLIETTDPRVLYFGYSLTEVESEKFDSDNY